jgi:hypothetical protein
LEWTYACTNYGPGKTFINKNKINKLIFLEAHYEPKATNKSLLAEYCVRLCHNKYRLSFDIINAKKISNTSKIKFVLSAPAMTTPRL